jgi:hypothetical protein
MLTDSRLALISDCRQLLDQLFKSVQNGRTMINLTPTQLRKAANIKERIDALQSELNEILGGEASAPAEPNEAPKKKWKMSRAGRARIAAAAKARWAKIKGTTASVKPAKKAKRKFTAAGRAALSAAAKARWAKAKKAGKSRL